MIEIQALSDALKNIDIDSLKLVLKKYKCDKDEDIETFLVNFAIDYELKNVARTFLIMSEEHPGIILGYFSIGLNVMQFDLEQEVGDAYEGINLYENGFRPIYKLFMIGKNSAYNLKFKMSDIFKTTILSYLKKVQDIVGGDLIYIDCVPELKNYYEKLDFKYYDSLNDVGLIRMIRKI